MSEFPLNRDATVFLTNSKFFEPDNRVKFISGIAEFTLFVTDNEGEEVPLAAGSLEQNRFDGDFEQGGSKFIISVESLELGGRKLLIGVVTIRGALPEAADTFVAEEDQDDEEKCP